MVTSYFFDSVTSNDNELLLKSNFFPDINILFFIFFVKKFRAYQKMSF